MKSISKLLVIYFIFLSLIPCSDQSEIEASEHTVGIVAMQGQEVPADDCTHQDDCSPLCVCNCCNVHVVFPSGQVSGFIKPFKVYNSELKIPVIPSPVFSIDYPPIS